MGLFTDSLLLLRCLPLGFDAPSAQRIGTDFSQAEGALRSEKSVEICGICGQQISAQCAKEQAECIILPRISQISTDAMRGAFIKNTDCTNAHGWVFSRILYSCSAAYRLVLMRRRRNGSDFSHAESALRSEKSVEICEICGRQLSAQCAKEQAECIYSPTDLSDKHRCHADCLSITQIAPSARQIDTDFSQAERCM